jgi:hypothetical protein
MHGILSIVIISAVSAATILIAGLVGYVELTRKQLSIKSR